MATYYWTHVSATSELSRYHIDGRLRERALELLADGLPITIGEMWYGGKFHYKLRYTERVDYPLRTRDLFIHSSATGHWVMDNSGSIHSVAFTSLETAQAYMTRRLSEDTQCR